MVAFLLPLALILLCFIFAVFALLYQRRKYWPSRGIPCPPPGLLIGNGVSLFGARPGILQLRDWTCQYGKVYGIQYGWRNVLVISDPAMVHDLLVTKFECFHGRNISPLVGNIDTHKMVHMLYARGSRWKRLRLIANPAFTVTNLKRSILLMDDSIKKAIEFLEEAHNEGRPINIHRHFIEMTFDVIARVALGQRESQQFRTELPGLAMASMHRLNNTLFDAFGWTFPWFGMYCLNPLLQWSVRWRYNPLAIVSMRLMGELRERKQQRQQRGGGRQEGVEENGTATAAQQHQQKAYSRPTDFIDLFLEVEANAEQQQQQGKLTEQYTQNGDVYWSKTTAQSVEKRNTMEEIVMQLMLFLFAGFDTTANSLAVLSHNLAIHPAVQAKIQEEIDTVCADEDPTYEQLGQLKYTEAVVKETLRLCPVAASVVNRVCAQTTTLGNITVEKGTAVHVDLISLQRDKTVWGEDAEEFRPERWLEEGRQLPMFYSFGGGPRICIGMRFAMVEEKLALVRLLRKYSIVRCADTERELEFTGQMVLSPKSVTVGLELRSDLQ